MTTITLEVPDEIADQLNQHLHLLPELLSGVLRQPLPPIEVYRYVLEFIASCPSPEQIASFGPSLEMRERLQTLMERERTNEISPFEKAELDEYERIESVIARIKTESLLFLTSNYGT